MDWTQRKRQAELNVAFFQGQAAVCDEVLKEIADAAAPGRPTPRDPGMLVIPGGKSDGVVEHLRRASV